MARVVEHLFHLTQLHYLPCIQHGYTVRNICHHAKVVRNKHNGIPEFLLQILYKLKYLRLNRNIQCGCRLITYKNLWLAGKRNCNNYSLAHTAGVLEGIVVKTLFRIRYSDLFHKYHCSFARFHLRAMLMLDNNRSNLLAYGYYRVQRGHRILEHGGNPLAANLSPVPAVLNFCKVQHAGAVQLLFILVKIFNAESNGVKHRIALLFVVKVNSHAHCLTQRLEQTAYQLHALICAVTPYRKIYLLCKHHVALHCLRIRLLLRFFYILRLELQHFFGIFRLICSILLKRSLMLLNGLLHFLAQSIYSGILRIDFFVRRFYFILFRGSIGLLAVIRFGSAEQRCINLFLVCLLILIA